MKISALPRWTPQVKNRASLQRTEGPLDGFTASQAPAESTLKKTARQPATGQSVAHSGQNTAERVAAGALNGAVAAGLQTGFVKGYVTPAQVYARCQQLARRYPDLVDLVERPYQSPGYDGKDAALRGPAPLYYLRLGPKMPDRDQKVGVFQFASPHAREWMNPMIMLELAEQLLANYDPNSQDPAVLKNTRLLQQLDVFLAPMTNPDGTNFSMSDEPMWRKTRVATEGEHRGVDVNRNYPAGWREGDPSKETYPGKAPLSEPETRHIVGVVDDHPNIRFVCDWHSYAEEIRRPWGVSEQDLPLYEQLHARMQQAIKSNRGRDYGICVSEVVSGSSDDYFYHDRKLYSMLVETGRAFQPKQPEALKVMEECVGAARELLGFAQEHQRQHGLALAHPPPEIPPTKES